MRRFATILIVLAAMVSTAMARDAAPASALLSSAQAQAKRDHKNVLVIFHASWCGWCHKLDDEFLADKQMGKLMNDSFVIVHLDVLENGDKKTLENPGGGDYLKQWNGDKGGIPFMVVLDPTGKKLIDSNRLGTGGSNIGYPAAPEEIAHFMKMLQLAPNMTTPQRNQVQAWLKAHAPKGG